MFFLSLLRYAYQISLFDSEHRQTGHKFEGLVTSTLKPIESQCGTGTTPATPATAGNNSQAAKDSTDIFVTTFAQARNYTDQWANLNFIIRMKKLVDDEEPTAAAQTAAAAPAVVTATVQASPASPEPVPSTSAAVQLPAAAPAAQPTATPEPIAMES